METAVATRGRKAFAGDFAANRFDFEAFARDNRKDRRWVQRMLRQCESGAGYDTGGDHAARNHVGELAAACVAYAKWRAFAAVKDY